MDTLSDGRRVRGQTRRTLNLEAAVKVVAEHGSGALTHRAVATEAGVSLASVTYHFHSIHELRQETFDYAGSRIGLAFRELIETSELDVVDLPDLTADFVASLVGERRADTVAVFEMILAASHDPTLRPIAFFLDERLTELLSLPLQSSANAHVLAGSIQGLILRTLAKNGSASELRRDTFELISRFILDDVAQANRDRSGGA